MFKQLVLCTTACLALSLQHAFSQQYKTLVITKTDSLYNVGIKKDYRKTNEDQITYQPAKGDRLITVPAQGVISYEKDGFYYRTKTIAPSVANGAGTQKLVRNLVDGPASLYISFNQFDQTTYYLQKKGGQLAPLEMEEHQLDEVFSQELAHYQEFKASDPKNQLKASGKAVYLHLSEYNQFTNKDFFEITKFKRHETVKAGVSAAIVYRQFDFEDFTLINDSHLALPAIGVKLTHNYTPRLGFDLGLYFNHISFSSKVYDYNINFLQLPVGLHYAIVKRNKAELFVQGGGLAILNVKSDRTVKSSAGKGYTHTYKIDGGSSVHPFVGAGFTYRRRHSLSIILSAIPQVQYTFYPTR